MIQNIAEMTLSYASGS